LAEGGSRLEGEQFVEVPATMGEAVFLFCNRERRILKALW
jgi:hypothetical protein